MIQVINKEASATKKKPFLFFMVKFWQVSNITLKSIYRRCSIKKAVLKNFAKFIGKHLCWSLFLINLQTYKPATLLEKTPTQVLSCECCEIFKNIYIKGHLWTTASELYWFKVEVIIEKADLFRDDDPRRIQNPVKHLRWSFLTKNSWLCLTVNYFCKTLHIICCTGLWICLW